MNVHSQMGRQTKCQAARRIFHCGARGLALPVAEGVAQAAGKGVAQGSGRRSMSR
jgi:hypothetical protein